MEKIVVRDARRAPFVALPRQAVDQAGRVGAVGLGTYVYLMAQSYQADGITFAVLTRSTASDVLDLGEDEWPVEMIFGYLERAGFISGYVAGVTDTGEQCWRVSFPDMGF